MVQWLNGFDELCLPVPVIGELRFGALNSNRAVENIARAERLISRCRILEVGQKTAEVYAQLRLGIKRKGRPIPENDLWIAAICVERGLSLAIDDAHFAAVDGLAVLACP